MSTLQEDHDALRKLMRTACRRWGASMPQELADWWVGEQAAIAAEKAAADQRRLVEIADIDGRIAALQARKSALEALL